MSIQECYLIELPKISNGMGNLSVIEGQGHIPFEIKRVYYLYDVPESTVRGRHAHKTLQQVIISMSGSFDITLDDGKKHQKYHLNRSYYGLYICPMIWREIDNFSSNSVCLVLASQIYDESDYIYDYELFLKNYAYQKF